MSDIVNIKMRRICNNVRELTGDTKQLGLDAIASNLINANNEVNEQNSLINQIKSAIDNLPTVNEESEIIDSFINRNFSTYIDNKITSIGDFTFAGCNKLTDVSFPAVTTIGIGAFMYCPKLTSACFSAVTTIASSTFYECDNLEKIDFPAVTTIGIGAFMYCRKLTTACFSAVTTIGNTAFDCCFDLLSVNFPVATTIGNYAFTYGYKLSSVSFPAVTTIGNNAFGYCYKLSSVSFPAANTIGTSAFVDCSILSAIYLPGSSICALSHSNAFTSTPYAGYSKYFSGTPHIYVPASLLTSYQTATNWTYFSSYFSTIESLDAE